MAGVAPGAGPSGEDFFPRLETLVSGSSEAVLFHPWGEEVSVPPPWLTSFAEALASLSPPLSSPEGA